MQDLAIDLRLAVNYLPACACAVQSVLLSFSLCAVHSVRLIPAFVPVCLSLVVHRARPRTLRIFDGSGVLFSIFLAHSVAAMQELGAGWWTLWPPVHVALSLEWPALAGYTLWNPPAHRAQLQAYLCLACLHASACAFMHKPEGPEHRLVRVGRDLAFAGLCLGWTYVVGIYRKKLSREPSESSSHFAVYFWPVLFVHSYAAAAYALACAGVIGFHLKPVEAMQPPVIQQEMAQVASHSQSCAVDSPAACHAPAEEPPADPDDEELFRQAMYSQRSAV